MEINGTTVYLAPSTLARRISYAGAEQAQLTQDKPASQPTQLLTAVEAAKKIDRFVMRNRSREQVYTPLEDLDPKSRKAIDAYQLAGGDDDLEYVSQVLGIDVYA